MEAVPFTDISGRPNTTKISYKDSTVTIADTGLYSVSFGISTDDWASPSVFQLHKSEDGSQFSQQCPCTIATQGELKSSSMSAVLEIQTNPTYLQLVNISGGSRVLNMINHNKIFGPCAYLTIIKLQ
jgi:hypothetical protein